MPINKTLIAVIASEARQSRGHGSPRPFGSRDDDAGAVIASPSPVIASEARQSMLPPPSPVNQVYNVAVGDRTTLNELFAQLHRNLLPRYPHLQGTQPVYRDFRSGDVRHSLADISKAQCLLGYGPHAAHRPRAEAGHALVHRTAVVNEILRFTASSGQPSQHIAVIASAARQSMPPSP